MIASMSVVSSSNVVLWLLGLLTVSVHLCEEVAVTRKKIQRIAKEKLLVLDETHCRLSAAPTHSVVLQGEDALVTVTDTGAYAGRIDMIACIHESGALPAFTLTPAQRQRDGVKVLTTNHLIRFITHTLAPAVATLPQSSFVLILDKSRIHNRKKIIDAFATAGVSIEEVLQLPSQAAKRLSPLDNALFHDWKDRVRAHCPLSLGSISRIMTREWEAITQDQIRAHYRHCGFYRGCSLYLDCSRPSVHKHSI
jgi:hypothetical protein